MSNTFKPLTIIYDSKCSLCRGSMKWIELKAINKNSFRFIACDSEERAIEFPLIQKTDCLKAMHVITPEKEVIKGDGALSEIVIRLKNYNKLTIFFKIPILRHLFYAVYRCIANNRYVISQTIWPLIDDR